jgi:DNA uptake protein ComE-like DNA-binding protein
MQPPGADSNQPPSSASPGPGSPPPAHGQPPTVVNVNNYSAPQPAYAWIPVIGSSPNGNIHIVHLLITVFTCGAWAPVWIIHAIIMAANDKRKVIYPVPPMPVPPSTIGPGYAPGIQVDRNQQAMAIVAQQKSRRAEARRLAADDPLTAKQLGVGRRDLRGRQYDDGGLIDINRVPAEIFTQFTGITADKAAYIVEVRERIGGAFSSVEEMMVAAEIPPHLAEEIAEYAIAIR